MSEVEFNEEVPQIIRPASREPRGLYRLVIQTKLATDESGARKVLIGISVGAVVIAGLILFLV